jgi:hypothetical protein
MQSQLGIKFSLLIYVVTVDQVRATENNLFPIRNQPRALVSQEKHPMRFRRVDPLT